MAHSSKRKRQKKKKHMIIVMELKDCVPGTERQECPKCLTAIINSPIPNRICWKCSPQASNKQLKAHTKSNEPKEEEEIVVGTSNRGNDAYSKSEDFFKTWHRDNGVNIPDCFQTQIWNLFFFSRGSMIREWGRCMNYWMKEESCEPVTDMTPGKQLEQKIKERREANGHTGPGFRTVEDKVANLRGAIDRITTPSSQVYTPGRGVVQVSHNAPRIARPTGEGGVNFVIV